MSLLPLLVSGTTAISAAIKMTYDRQLIERAMPALVFSRYGVSKNIPARGGTTIEIRKLSSLPLATTALTEGTYPTQVVATFSTIAISVSQYGQWAAVSDLVDTQAYDNVVAEFVENFGESMGKTLDIIIRDAIFAGVSNTQYAGSATTRASLQATTATASNKYMDSAEIREAVNTLKRSDVAPVVDGKYVMVLHPDSAKDLFSDADIVNAFSYAANRGDGNPLFSGVLGDYMGVRFVETTHSPTINQTTATIYNYIYRALLIGKGAYAISKLDALSAKTILHPRGTGGHADPLEQVTQIGWKAAVGCGTINGAHMVNIEHITSNTSMVT